MNNNGFLEHLKKGLRISLRDIQDFSEDHDAEIYPEYLKTISIARVLKDKFGPSAWIRLEQATNRTTSNIPLGDA